MMLPTLTEIRQTIRAFVQRERITPAVLLQPRRLGALLVQYRYAHFFGVGVGGALINLGVTWCATTFLYGHESYFVGYLWGIVANLAFNFSLYTLSVFSVSRAHLARLVAFLVYGTSIAALQAVSVQALVAIVGTRWYLLVIAMVIVAFSALNFLVFKLAIFRERFSAPPERTVARSLAAIVVLSVVLRLGALGITLFLSGPSVLVYGDAVGYLSLGVTLWEEGVFTSMQGGEVKPEVFRAPGLPLLLAPFATGGYGVVLYGGLLALVAGFLLPLLTYRVALSLVQPQYALWAAFLVAVEPHLVLFSSLPQTEVPFMLFAYGGFALVLASHAQARWYGAVLGGVLLGYACLIRPGFWPVVVCCTVATVCYTLITRRVAVLGLAALMSAGVLLVVGPWFIRTHTVTGVYALAGTGWRNVYTDYLASLRALEKQTSFAEEKAFLREVEAMQQFGLAAHEINSPAHAQTLKKYALAELWHKRTQAVHLESMLLLSFFTHDGYYYAFRRVGFLPQETGQRASPMFLLLSGQGGVGAVLAEISRQYYIPLVGRAWTYGVALFACIGFFVVRSPLRFVYASVIVLSALFATVIGLGVESRLRLPVEPLLFIFAAPGVARIRALAYRLKNSYAH